MSKAATALDPEVDYMLIELGDDEIDARNEAEEEAWQENELYKEEQVEFDALIEVDQSMLQEAEML